ncbi:MAG: tryptophan-rich sensory protein [Gemmataceae bacterium]
MHQSKWKLLGNHQGCPDFGLESRGIRRDVDGVVRLVSELASSIIRLIWMLLYPIILVSFASVFGQAYRSRLGRKVTGHFGINLAANLVFMPTFSSLPNMALAALAAVVVWVTI